MGAQSHAFVGCIKWDCCNRLTASVGFRWSRDGKITHNAGFYASSTVASSFAPPSNHKNTPVPRFTGNKRSFPSVLSHFVSAIIFFSLCHPSTASLTKRFLSFVKLLMVPLPLEEVSKICQSYLSSQGGTTDESGQSREKDPHPQFERMLGWPDIIAFHLWLKFNPIRSTHTELSNRNNCELKDSCLPCRNHRPLADNITAK